MSTFKSVVSPSGFLPLLHVVKRAIRIIPLLYLMLFAVSAPAAAAQAPLQVGINLWVGWMPWWIVEQKGLLKAHNVNAKLRFFGVQSESMNALASGHLDACSLATNDVISVNKAKAATSIVLLNDESSGADMMIARGIKSGKDLSGQKIAVEVGGVSHFFLSKILEKNGLTEKNVVLANMSAADAGAAFIAKRVNVAVTWEPYASQAIKSGGVALFTSKDTPNAIVDVLAVRNEVIKQRPEDVKQLIQVWFEALKFIKTNPDEAFAIMAKASDVSVPEFMEMWRGVKIYTLNDNLAAFGSAAKPGPYYKTVDDMSTFMVKQKLIEHPVSSRSMLNPNFLNQ